MTSQETSGEAPAVSPRLSVVLATLNERQCLPQLLAQISSQRLPPYEVVIVDDGSTDGTRDYLRDIARTDPHIRPIFHEGVQTLTPALCQGVLASRGEYVAIMDADLQHPPETLPVLIGALEDDAALAIASRYLNGSNVNGRTTYRAIISRGAELLAKMILPEARTVSDPMSGYFAFRREVFKMPNPPRKGYKILLFLLVMSEGRRIVEVPYEFRPRSDGSSKITQTPRFFLLYLLESSRARAWRRYLRESSAGIRNPPSPSRAKTRTRLMVPGQDSTFPTAPKR